ncbi:MAG: membrane protein [Pirellulaceae bacterium]|nr:MAG: membrane protein [Pirellulaceae bacterium]
MKHLTVSGVVAITLAIAMRLAVLLHSQDTLTADPDSYRRLAINLAQSGVFGFEDDQGKVYPTAYRPPLYPWLLSWLVVDGVLEPAAVIVLHAVLGVATVLGVHWLAVRLQVLPAWVPALAIGIDPLLLRQSQLIMTETLATFLAVLGWAVWQIMLNSRSRWGAASSSLGMGLVFGLAVLTRPTNAVWAFLCLLILGWQGAAEWSRSRAWRASVGRMFGVLLGLALCVGPWTLRNYKNFGVPIWGTTHGGYTLLLANNPMIYNHFRQHGPSRKWDAQPFHQTWAARHDARLPVDGVAYWQVPDNNHAETNEHRRQGDAAARSTRKPFSEIEDDRRAYRAAIATIRRNVEMFFLSALYRLGWLWAWWPTDAAPWVSCIIGAWYAGWSFAAVGGLLRRSWYTAAMRWAPGLAMVIALTMVHAVFWSNMRMRCPAMPAVYLLGVCGWRTLADRFHQRLAAVGGAHHSLGASLPKDPR